MLSSDDSRVPSRMRNNDDDQADPLPPPGRIRVSSQNLLEEVKGVGGAAAVAIQDKE